MIITTKKYRLSTTKFVRVGFWNILKRYRLLGLGLSLLGALAWYYFSSYRLLVTLLILLLALIILGGIWGQLEMITKMEAYQLFFERVAYRITPQEIMIQINARQGIPIGWQQIESVACKREGYYLFLSPVLFLFLPNHIFQGEHQKSFLNTLLKRKGYTI